MQDSFSGGKRVQQLGQGIESRRDFRIKASSGFMGSEVGVKGGSVPQNPGRQKGRSKVKHNLEKKTELPSDSTEEEKTQFVQHSDMQGNRGIRQRFKVNLGYMSWPQKTKKKEKEEEGASCRSR